MRQIVRIPLYVALRLVLSGEFAFDNWSNAGDTNHMRGSITTMMSNISLMGGLVLTFLVPPLLADDAFQMSPGLSTVDAFRSCGGNCPRTELLPPIIMTFLCISSISCLGATMVALQNMVSAWPVALNVPLTARRLPTHR